MVLSPLPLRSDLAMATILGANLRQREDASVTLVSIKRPREEILHQVGGQVRVGEYLRTLATTKRVRRLGFQMYRPVSDDDFLQEGVQYYLLWNREEQGRGGSARSLTTTEPCSDSQGREQDQNSEDGTDVENMVNRRYLSYLEDLVCRLRMANSWMRAWEGGV